MLEVVGVSKKFKNTTALDNINVTLDDKGLVAVLGESGSGKSTLFNILTGMVKPDGGKVVYNGIQLNTDGKINSRNVFGIIFQDGNLFGGLTVKQNLDICSRDERKQTEILQNLGIKKYLNTDVAKLSGGEMQRVAIARALLDDNDILLADEPTGSLDEKNGEKVMSILKDISAQKLVIVITHNTEFAAKYADRIIKIAKGKIVEESQANIGKSSIDDNQDNSNNQRTFANTKIDNQNTRRLSATSLNKFCFAKIKNTFVKSITSICIFAVTLLMIVLSLALIMTDCRKEYFKSIRGFEHSALYNDKDMYIFATKLDGADMQGLTRYYNYYWTEGQNPYIVVDDSLNDDEIMLGVSVAHTLDERRLSPLKSGDLVNYHDREFIVQGIIDRQNYGYGFDLNFAVYLNDKVARDIILAPNMVLLDSRYRLEMTVVEDESLRDGECRLGFGLYYNLATRDEEFIDLKKNSVTWCFSENNTKLYCQDYSIVSVDVGRQDMNDRTLYVSTADYDQISNSRLYYGYFLKTQDAETIDYWLDRGVEIYNQDFETYLRAKEFREVLLPYAAVMLAVGVVLSVLYMIVILSHIVAVNTREIYILKTLRVSDKSIFGALFVQSLPIILCANALVLAINIIAKTLIEKYIPFLVLQVAISSIISIVSTLAIALVLIMIKIGMLNKNFNVNFTR